MLSSSSRFRSKSTPQLTGGRLVFHVFAALAEFERELIRERTKAGVDAARLRGKRGKRGKRGGRRHKLGEAEARTLAAMAKQKIPTEQICGSMGISRATYFRYLKAAA